MPARAALREVGRVQEPLEPPCFVWLRWRQALALGQAHCQRKKGCACHNESQQGEGDQPDRGRLGVGISSDPADRSQVRAKDRSATYAHNARVTVLLSGIPLISCLVFRCALT
jgi:hypothetical protein